MIMTGVGGPPSKQAVTTMEQGRPENYKDGQLELDAEKSRFVTVAFVVVVVAIQKVQGVTTSPSGSLCSYSYISGDCLLLFCANISESESINVVYMFEFKYMYGDIRTGGEGVGGGRSSL